MEHVFFWGGNSGTSGIPFNMFVECAGTRSDVSLMLCTASLRGVCSASAPSNSVCATAVWTREIHFGIPHTHKGTSLPIRSNFLIHVSIVNKKCSLLHKEWSQFVAILLPRLQHSTFHCLSHPPLPQQLTRFLRPPSLVARFPLIPILCRLAHGCTAIASPVVFPFFAMSPPSRFRQWSAIAFVSSVPRISIIDGHI